VRATVTTTNSGNFTGSMTTSSMTGGSDDCETVVMGRGHLGGFTFNGTPGTIPNVGGVSGSCSNGRYTRADLVMQIEADCSFSTNGGAAEVTKTEFVLDVVWPAGQNGITVPITSASLLGTFV